MRRKINPQKGTKLTQMGELIDKEIKSYFKQIPYIQEGKGKNEH